MNTAWNFAPLAFHPYPDVGEFVNVGVLALAVPARVLAYRLLPAQATARIHGFFPELDIAIYKEGRRRIEAELQRLESTINSTQGEGAHHPRAAADQPPLPGSEVQADTLFKALTAPRDGLFRFHAKGTRLAASPDDLLDALFDRYITRNTAESDDPEEIRLVRQMGDWLEQWKLRRFYRSDVRVGPDEFPIRFTFGYQPDPEAAPQRVIKPLNLAQANPLQVFHHGDLWVANVKRLQRMNALPPHVLLSVKMPLATRGAARAIIKAAEEIHDQLARTPIRLAAADDMKTLREFAEIPQESTLSLTA
jgi:hypothetical protein